MAKMTFLYQNYFNTTTALSVTVNTTGVANLIDRNEDTYWTMTGYSSTTACTFTWTPSSPKVISKLMLRNINWKNFAIYQDSTTASNLTINTGNTTTSVWSANSETSLY